MTTSKKNVLLIVCDGLTYNMLVDLDGHSSPMPFVKSLKKNSIWCTEAYSHGPYTESAIKSVLHGKMPLESGGFFVEHIDWEDSVFKQYKESGYDLFTTMSLSFIPPEVTTEGAFSYNLKANPMFSRYLRGKLDYYHNIWKKETITEGDLKVIKRLLDRTFESIFIVYRKTNVECDFTGEYTPFEKNDSGFLRREASGLLEIQKEYEKYISNKDEYITNLFNSYETSKIINDFDWDGSRYSKTAVDQKEWIKTNYSSFFKEIKKKNRALYLKNHFPSIKNINRHLKLLFNSSRRKEGIEFFGRLFLTINRFDSSKMLDINLPQVYTSAGCFVDQFIDWRKKKKTNHPFFAYFHFDEFHRPLSFISHETNDYDRLNNEFLLAQEYVKNVPRNYHGVLGFDLAAQYLDCSIERLFTYLRDNNEADDTIVVITADHGSSNCGETERFTCTNHFYKEQYHIPIIITGGQPRVVSRFVNGIDLLPTLNELTGVPCHSSWSGVSFLHLTHDFTTVEYTGGGVPDLLRRPVKFGYRDATKSFVVEGIINKSPNSDSFRLLEYYDLQKDPNEINDISKKLDYERVEYCKSFFIERLKYLYYDYYDYLNQLE